MSIESEFSEDPSLCSKTEPENNLSLLCPSFVERYFTKLYAVNLPLGHKAFQEAKCTNNNDVCILRHSNKLCLITLAPSHPIISDKSLTVTGISYKVTDRLDHSRNQVSGKRKRGAHWLNPTTPLCIVTCSDGSRHTVHCGTRGSLVEINDRIVESPSLLQRSYATEGFIAIVMPKVNESSSVIESLLSEAQFQDYCDTSRANAVEV